MHQLKPAPLVTTLILAGVFSGAVGINLNLSDFGLFGDLNNLLKVDSSATAMFDWFMRLSDRCKNNKVPLDLKAVIKAYTCLGKMESTLISGDDVTDSYFDKLCHQWPAAMKCLRPIFTQLELCFSGELVNLEGVLIEGLNGFHKPLCSSDPSFVNAIIEDGPAAVGCLSNHTDVVVDDVIECYDRRASAGKEICEAFDVYIDCFLQSLDICNNRKVEKLIHILMERAGFKKIIYKYILKCKPEKVKKG